MRDVDRYGDDFEITVGQSEPGTGAGADVDSASKTYTAWYQRTDEHGNPVGYDYDTGTWADGWTRDGRAEREDDPEQS